MFWPEIRPVLSDHAWYRIMWALRAEIKRVQAIARTKGLTGPEYCRLARMERLDQECWRFGQYATGYIHSHADAHYYRLPATPPARPGAGEEPTR